MDPEAVAAWEQARPGHRLPLSVACVAPWVALELDPAGWVYACCANQTYPLGRIGESRLPELWGGDRMAVLREALARWDFSVGCQSCRWHLEHARMDPDAEVYEHYPIDELHPVGPRAMTFALSNRCNLGCVMCNPALSSTLRKQAGMAPLESRYDDQFFEDLRMFLPTLSYAKFLGGEPFLIPEHHRVWDLMDEVGGPPRMLVTTNGTVWSDRVAWLLERFSFDLTVSIDATTKATYEGIRRGATFEQVLENVERLRAACATSHTELRFCFCLMDRNWQELGDFLVWAAAKEASVSINLVSDAGFALHDLPLASLDEIAASWAEQEPSIIGAMGEHAATWEVQRRQLDLVRAERRAGTAPPSKQPARAHGDLLAVSLLGPGAATATASDLVDEHRGIMRRWCGGATVGEVELDADRTVVAVAVEHERLGLVADGLVGAPAASVVDAISAADGRALWVLDAEGFGDHGIQVLGLSTNPVRGNPGCMVRIVEVRRGEGSVLLVAEDRLLDDVTATGRSVSVAAPRRSPSDPASN